MLARLGAVILQLMIAMLTSKGRYYKKGGVVVFGKEV